MARRQKRLYGDYELLTTYDICKLIQVCSEDISRTEHALLLSSLLTGRSIEQLLDPAIDFKRSSPALPLQGHGVFFSSWQLQNQKTLSTISSFTHDSFSQGATLIAIEVTGSLQKLRRLERECQPTEESLQRYLSKINRSYNTRLSLARIRHHFHVWCVQFGISEVVYAAISGKPIGYHAGIYYTRLSNNVLLEKLRQYWQCLYKGTGIEEPSLPEIEAKLFWGSNRVPIDTQVSNFYRDTAKIVGRAKRAPRHLDLLHDYFCAYCLLILMLLTGLRPTNKFFGPITNFDLSTGFVAIKDKGDASRRHVYLPPKGQTQLKQYLDFLEVLSRYLRFREPEQYQVIKAKLSGNADLFTFLGERNSSANNDLQRLRELFVHYYPMPLNWNRHLLRTKLENAKYPPDIIDHFMNHESKLDSSHGQFSSVSRAALINIAHFIEKQTVDELGIPLLANPLKGK
ncbi:hypothetical protein P2G88_06735 [Aliiglaciecola sp. CAU 1673]|uniref:hypothetical protein n=1 Tax=Aliiglaciecola sp. CAU 1673 TaxID=3032595 RepID=UPI0023DB70E3|nr:hypothetical protein [Aliiglaciecola sp. CAU 1673]MDF2177943.1 hypothetical protein [Aliiglaciecola sp. CAU 1673]